DEEARSAPYHRPEALQVIQARRAAPRDEIDEQNRQCRLVQLDSLPIGGAIEPRILRPMTVSVLAGLQIPEDAQRVVPRARGEESARRFDEVTWPDEMIPAEIGVALRRPPR